MRFITYMSAVLATLVLGSLGVLTLADIVEGPDTERQERVARTPALPKSVSDLKGFLGETRYYVGERYALKERFVTWNGMAMLAAFNHSPANNVALGREGFLFLTTEGAIEITQGQERLSQAEEALWRDTFRKMQQAFNQIGAGYSLVIGPNKHTVYSEVLPSWVLAVPLDQTRTDDILRVAATVGGLAVPDTRRILAEARTRMADALLYHPTDTHWTELGAALVVHEALTEMGLDVSPPEFDIADLPRSGDLSRMIGQQGRWNASGPELPRTWQCHDQAGQPLNVVTIDPLMPRRFTCGSPDGQDTQLVVFHDSFGVAAIPYIAARFKQVEFIWSNAAEPAEAERLQAEHVLHIIVERRLITKTPESLLLEADARE